MATHREGLYDPAGVAKNDKDLHILIWKHFKIQVKKSCGIIRNCDSHLCKSHVCITYYYIE